MEYTAAGLSTHPYTFVMVTDAGSDIFAAMLHILTQAYGIVWFYGPSHSENRIVTNTIIRGGLKDDSELKHFLIKFNHGPWKSHDGALVWHANRSVGCEI